MTPPAASSAARAAPLAPRRPIAPSRPRRVSGPLRVPARNAPARRAVAGGGGLVLGLLGWLETLSSHRLLDRLIRGRMWIGIVAFALIGIVTLQLGLLKLNSSIGRALQTESRLQRENAALSIENSELSGGGRVESQAQRLGMRLTSVGGLQFHDSHAGSDVPQAAAALKETPKPVEASEATTSEATTGEATSSETTGSESAESSPESSSSAGGAGAEGAGTSSGASSEGSGSSESSTAPTGGESREAPAPAGASESSGEAGGGTAAPGG